MNFKELHLSEGKTIISREPGNSMTPRIKSGQPVKIEPATVDTVKSGDIVYCKVHGRYYTHIVIAKDEKKGCLIGNNHGRANGWTKNIYGKVIEIIKVK